MKRADENPKKHILWQLPLAVMLFCFGLLLMTQYYTHVDKLNSLEGESPENLAQIMRSAVDSNAALSAEYSQLKSDLAKLESALASGDTLQKTMNDAIGSLKAATGWEEVNGEGVLVTITNISNLYYWDLVDIVNELFNAGAEAVSINSTRITIHTQITEKRKVEHVFDEATGESAGQSESIVHIVGGQELQPPYQVRAIGSSASLETALNMPGGIIEQLTTIYAANVTVQRMANLTIPRAVIPAYRYATIPESSD